MTESEWLCCTDVLTLIAELAAWAQQQKRRLRLFSIACCRQLGRWVVNERLWKCLDAAERYAEGKLKDSGLDHWTAEANKSWIEAGDSRNRIRNKAGVLKAHQAIAYTCLADRYGAYGRAAAIILGAEKQLGKPFVEEMRSLFPHLFRDVFGNPFCPVQLDPAWRTRPVLAMAEAMVASRTFDAMPVLADALEEAGCSESAILSHCRQQRPHISGCWLVDLLRRTQSHPRLCCQLLSECRVLTWQQMRLLRRAVLRHPTIFHCPPASCWSTNRRTGPPAYLP